LTQADYQNTYKALSCNSVSNAMACTETTNTYQYNDKGIMIFYNYVQNQTYNCVTNFGGQ
jgi:hypothetical protein